MERMKMKFIIAVTEVLRDAPQSEAKVDLIEEVSENLYQRSLEFIQTGLTEDEAYAKAMEELGDVEELRRLLTGAAGKTERRDDSILDRNIDELVRSATELAREAAAKGKEYAREAAGWGREYARKFKEKYPNGFSFHFGSGKRNTGFWDPDAEEWDGENVGVPAAAEVNCENVSALDITTSDGDIVLRTLDGDEERLVVTGAGCEVILEDGLIRVEQMEGGEDLEVIIPNRHWARVAVHTACGDFRQDGGLDADEFLLHSDCGDLELMDCGGAVTVESAAGDVTLTGVFGSAMIKLGAGDCTVEGTVWNTLAVTASAGDVEADLDALPETTGLATRAGDVTLAIPGDKGFTLSVRKGSGDFDCDFQLEKTADGLRWLDGAAGHIKIAALLGDISLESK